MNTSDASNASTTQTAEIPASPSPSPSPVSDKTKFKKHYKQQRHMTTQYYNQPPTPFENLKNSPLGSFLILFAISQIFGLETLILAAILLAIFVHYK